MLRLKKVEAKGVRGIVDGPDLYFENGGLLLCGDNGTGKSSYVDAIEKVLSGKCSSLDNVGQSVSWNKQGTHLTSTESEIALTLTDGAKNIVVNLDTDCTTLDKQTHSFVLRRRTLLNFIDAKPSERYKSIEEFIKLDSFINFETSLKELQKRVDTELTVTTEKKEQHENALKEILALPKNFLLDETSCLQVANDVLQTVQIPTVNAHDSITQRIEELEKLLAPVSNIDTLQKTQVLSELLNQFPDANKLLGKAQNYAKQRKELLSEEAISKGHFYAQVLEDGLTWIEEDNLKQCPLCNSPITISDVSLHITSCLQNNEKLIRLKKEQSISQREFLEALQSYKVSLTQIKTSWQNCINQELPVKVVEAIGVLEELNSSHENVLSLDQIENDIVRLANINLDNEIQLLKNTIKNKLDALLGDSNYLKLYEAKSKLSAIATHFTNGAQKIAKNIEHLTNCHNQLILIIDIAEQARKNAVQKLLDAVVGIADKYFQKIHPGEEIGKPELSITHRGTGSIELKGKFHGETGDPRGHFSEGHVDSLGLCLFLAIRRLQFLQRPELSLLILDDVMHSVDARHRLGTANLIFEEFKDHQIIITTHDPVWFEYLKMASRKSKNRFVHKRIADWTLQSGPIFGDHLSNFEWLSSETGKTAKPADQVIKAGLLLEEMLQNLCNNLSIPVSFRIKRDYTIDLLWNSFCSAAQKNKEFYKQSESCIKRIDDLRNLRNWVGAHWNEWAQLLTTDEAKAFSNAVLELRNIVYCEECNQFINKIYELNGVWSCKGEHKRYNQKEI